MTVLTTEQRRHALQATLAARLELAIADQSLKRSMIIPCASTLRNLLKGRNVTLATLVDVADGANLDVEIVLHRR